MQGVCAVGVGVGGSQLVPVHFHFRSVNNDYTEGVEVTSAEAAVCHGLIRGPFFVQLSIELVL